MNIQIDEKRKEAIKRMKALGILPEAINQFRRGEPVMVSEPPFGGLYYVEPELQKRIDDFENENNAVVYLVVRSFTSIGKMDSLLFVSDYKEEWEMDVDDIKNGIVFTYTINYDMPDCSEFGSIGYVRTVAGSIIRVS